MYQAGGDELKPDPGVRFTTEPADLVALEGEPALLPCAAAAARAVRLSWRHSARGVLTRDHTITISDLYRRQLANGSLVIEKMSASLAGQYQCVAAVDGVGTIVSKTATVFLAELPTIAPGPRWVSGPAGGALLLACAVSAPPRLALRIQPAAEPPDRRVYGAARLQHQPPTLLLNVTWLRNGAPVVLEAGRVAVSGSGALELDPLRPRDAATYRCRVSLARRPHHYVTGPELEVRVEAEAGSEQPPRFVATPRELTVLEGSSVTFDCAAVGSPKPEMTWLNNGVEIDLSDLDSRFYRWGCGSLRVQSARALDAGAYTCRAHSRLDSADHTALLHVQVTSRGP
ncbi:netrin receptor DCC-like [Ostrinia furnacalis]|uniref:netrin receptor DCC-like n=1 Tax=Ostrinia furnacalis TaxID=93504 RepID=UPI00103BDE29|nr:netrin receptor DCC-like [Ostrinia furnacalis]